MTNSHIVIELVSFSKKSKKKVKDFLYPGAKKLTRFENLKKRGL